MRAIGRRLGRVRRQGAVQGKRQGLIAFDRVPFRIHARNILVQLVFRCHFRHFVPLDLSTRRTLWNVFLLGKHCGIKEPLTRLDIATQFSQYIYIVVKNNVLRCNYAHRFGCTECRKRHNAITAARILYFHGSAGRYRCIDLCRGKIVGRAAQDFLCQLRHEIRLGSGVAAILGVLIGRFSIRSGDTFLAGCPLFARFPFVALGAVLAVRTVSAFCARSAAGRLSGVGVAQIPVPVLADGGGNAVFPVSTGLRRVCFQAVLHNFLYRFRVNSAALRQRFIDRRHKIGLDLRVQRLQVADHTLNLRPDRQGRLGRSVAGGGRRALDHAQLRPDGGDHHMILRVHAVYAHVQTAPSLADHLRRDRHLTAGVQHILRLCAPKNHGFPEGIPRGIRVPDSHHRTHDPSGNRLQANRLAPAPADPYFCYFHFIILSAGRMIHPASLCAKAWNVAYRVGI